MRARLLHPVDIVVRNISDATPFDTDFEESPEIIYDDDFTIRGQARHYRSKKTESGGAGWEMIGDGYVLCYAADAADVKVNAEIVSIGGVAAGYRVIEQRPCVHYGGPEMRMLFYKYAGRSTETR